MPLLDNNDKQPINESNVTLSKIKQLRDDHWDTLEELRNRIKEVRASIQGETQFKLPDDFDVPGKESLLLKFPAKIVMPLQILSLLEQDRPTLKRYSIGPSLRAQTVATDVETWVNAVCNALIPWRKLMQRIFIEGACAVGAIPTTAHWVQAPTFLDTIDGKRWARLSEKRKDGYESESDGTYTKKDRDGNKLPKKRYFRDAKGREEDDEWYTDPTKKRTFREDRKATRKAWETERRHWLARRLPFTVRVESAMDCVPFFGDTEDDLIGILIQTDFSEEELVYQDLIWDRKAAVVRDQGTDGEGKKKDANTLYEWWFYNEAKEPCVAYAVNMKPTKMRQGDDEVEAVINLTEEYGLTRLPWKWVWGQHIDTGDIGKKAIPYNWPILPVLTAMEALATSMLVHTYTMAFGGWAVDISPELAVKNPSLVMDGNKPRQYKFNPMTITNVPGRPVPLFHPGAGGNAEALMRLLLNQAESNTPASSVFGGGGAASGHDRALTKQYLQTALDQTRDAALKAVEFIGETILEAACGIIEQLDDDESIPVYENTDVQQINKGESRESLQNQKYRSIIELKPEWVGPIYDLEAVYAKSVGDNLAKLEQLASHYEKGMVTWRQYREEGHGDTHPEQTLIEVWVDQYLRTDAGRAEIAKLAEKMLMGQFDEEKDALVAEGQILPDGTPVDALAEGAVLPGQPAAPGLPQGMPNVPPMSPADAGGPPNGAPPPEGLIQQRPPGDPRSVLGGIVAGGMGTGPANNDARAIAEI